MDNVRAAIVDGDTFYAFARLTHPEEVKELLELKDLQTIERYVRTFVLHDLSLAITPGALEYVNADNVNALKLSVMAGMKNPPGSRTEVRSALLTGEWEKVLTRSEEYPTALFKDLDIQWQEYASTVAADGCGLLVPPVLSIVLTRCARRDAIATVLKDLHSEWAGARKKVWDALDALRDSRTLGEAIKIRRELSESSKLFAPQSTAHDSRPIRVLWELCSAGVVGASIATLLGANPAIGALTGAVGHIPRSVPALLDEFGPTLFGRSAFDLARRVRRATSQVEVDALSRLLTKAEKQRLGLR